LAGKPVIARLKWGLEYRGFLVSVDNYMNLQVGAFSLIDIAIWVSRFSNLLSSAG
jgi:small nuclear ribonucleoprotein (snRNP)-like protein